MKNFFIYISIACFFLFSCEQEESKGTPIGFASSNFEITSPLSISADPINFQTEDTLLITAEFNEVVNYTITITGLHSGAERRITGTTSSLNEVWLGDASLFFFTKEDVNITLSVLGKDEPITKLETEITEIASFKGVIISDFEQTTASCWFPEMNMISCDRAFRPERSLEGEFAHQVSGVSTQTPVDNFIGLASIVPRRNVNRNGSYFMVPTTNPEELYFNIYILGKGDENVAMFIKFMQDDNQDGSHEADRENGFEMQLTDLSHTGWKKFSFKYSDVPLGGNASFGGNGDGVYRPELIRKIELGLWALRDPTSPVEFIYDFASFTSKSPVGE